MPVMSALPTTSYYFCMTLAAHLLLQLVHDELLLCLKVVLERNLLVVHLLLLTLQLLQLHRWVPCGQEQ